MKYQKYMIYALSILLLIALYLISSTDLIYKEQENEIYHISVILNETTDTCFVNTKLGMKQAEKEWTIDVNLVTLYEPNDVDQQVELILREIENGAQAILVCPIDCEALAKRLEQEHLSVPIISMGAQMSEQVVQLSVFGDEEERCQQLADKIIKDGNQSIYILKPKVEKNNCQQRLVKLQEVFAKGPFEVKVMAYEGEEEVSQHLSQIVKEKSQAALIAIDAMTLEAVINQYEEIGLQSLNLYGIGYTDKLLNDLDQGYIKAMAIHNDYDIGYISLSGAIFLLQNKKANSAKVIGGLVTRENMYDSIYEKILFPIN